jgi:hypothetical protein
VTVRRSIAEHLLAACQNYPCQPINDESTLGGKPMRSLLFLAVVAGAALLPAADSAADPASDKAMADRIGARLKESGRLRNYEIGVTYQDGVAWLHGRVTNPAQRDAAVSLAESAPGVNHVVCQLEVAAGQSGQGGRSELTNAFNAEPAAAHRANPSGVIPAVGGHNSGNPMAGSARSMPRNNMAMPRHNMPMPAGRMAMNAAYNAPQNDTAAVEGSMGAVPTPNAFVPGGSARAVSYDNAQMPGYAWPSYASYPNYAAITYPQQYSPTAWPYIGPFYPYPQVPLAWRKVSLEWDDGWWFLDFSAHNSSH